MKICRTCEASKPSNEFPANRLVCTPCVSIEQKKQRELKQASTRGVFIEDPEQKIHLLIMSIQKQKPLYWCDCCQLMSIENIMCEEAREVGFIHEAQ